MLLDYLFPAEENGMRRRAAVCVDPQLIQRFARCRKNIPQIGLYTGQREWDDGMSIADFEKKLAPLVSAVRDGGKIPVLVSCNCWCHAGKKREAANALRIDLVSLGDWAGREDTFPSW